MEDYEENKVIDGEEKLGSIITSIRVSRHFYDLCKEYNIEFTEASRVGISLLLAEKGVKPYDNSLNVYRKMIRYQQMVEEKSNEIELIKANLEATKKLNDLMSFGQKLVPEETIEKEFKEAGL